MRYFWFVFLFFIVAYLVPLAGRPLVTPDEFRYAEIPREMIATTSPPGCLICAILRSRCLVTG